LQDREEHNCESFSAARDGLLPGSALVIRHDSQNNWRPVRGCRSTDNRVTKLAEHVDVAFRVQPEQMRALRGQPSARTWTVRCRPTWTIRVASIIRGGLCLRPGSRPERQISRACAPRYQPIRYAETRKPGAVVDLGPLRVHGPPRGRRPG
jgi:hypothetical protein